MFEWLTGRKAADDSDRLVFRFKDGTRKRYADPVAVERSLIELLGRDWRRTVSDLAKPIPSGLVGEQREEAEAKSDDLRTRVLKATYLAFKVEPLRDDGDKMTGLTEVEAFDLLGGFLRFCSDLIRLARPFQRPQSRASPSNASLQPASGSVST